MAQSYKTLKEDFVSNLSGGTISEINYVTAVAPVAVFLWSCLQSRCSFFSPYGPAPFVTDFLLNIGALLLGTTLYSSNPLLLNALLISPSLVLHFLPSITLQKKRFGKPPRANGSISSSTGLDVEKLDLIPIRPFVTWYRGGMMVITCLSILAVDFRIFPRRFAKVENWGTSLMDLGVGSFVFSAGLVSAKSIIKDRSTQNAISQRESLYKSLRHSAPLCLLGIARLYSVKGLDYAEHITEYGVHWNFFFTLAFLPPFVALFQSFLVAIPSHALLALLLGIAYQIVLDYTGLKAFIFTAPRSNILNKNREGIFSLIGYLAIFLAGQATGAYVLPRSTKAITENPAKQRKLLLIRLLAWSVSWIALLATVTSFHYGIGLKVSRRLANLPYILWVSAFNCTQLTIYCAIETVKFPEVCKANDKATEHRECERATSKVLHSFNRNGLAIFLFANLLTGLVNLSVDTLAMDTEKAMAVLIIYVAILTSFAMALDKWNISIKL